MIWRPSIKVLTDKVIKDSETVIKTASRDAICWEASILGALEGVDGVPHVRGKTNSMGSEDTMTLVVDLMPGVPLSSGVKHDPRHVMSQLYTILWNVYAAGVAHMNVTPDNVLCSEDGTVSLIGFSGAAFIEPNPIDRFRSSPDVTGINNGFTLTGPNKTITGSFSSLVMSL